MGKCECLDEILSSFEARQDNLIPILQRVQSEFGYLSEEWMFEVARFARVPESAVYAVATFYTQFRFSPIGKKHIMVCRGTACHVSGAPRILAELERQLGIKEGETTPNLEYSLETVACIGACGLAPCVMTNNQVAGKMTSQKVAKSLAKDRAESEAKGSEDD